MAKITSEGERKGNVPEKQSAEFATVGEASTMATTTSEIAPEERSSEFAAVNVPLTMATTASENDQMERRPEKQSAEFAYVEREHFTSEVFKIEIGNIPKYFGFGECKKLLKKRLKLNPHKIKQIPSVGKVYVTFKNEKDKEDALEKLDKFEYKGRVLAVKSAKPKSDAMAVKRPGDDDDLALDEVKRTKVSSDEIVPNLTPAEMIVKSVTSWHNVPYEEQLTRKHSQMKTFLCNCRTRMGKLDLDREVFVWIMKHRAECEGMCCPLHPVLPSPTTMKYRNKSEFTAGLNTSGQKTVGYRLGKYRDKTCAVEETGEINILPDNMKEVSAKFQEFIRASEKGSYNPQNYAGHWRQLTVRTTLKGEVMATVVVTKKKDRNEAEELEEKESLKKFFLSEDCAGLVSTLLYQIVPTHRRSGEDIDPPQVIFGCGYITEQLLGLQFRISPDAFFQCNTSAAEVLYTNIGNMLEPEYVTNKQMDEDDTTKDLISRSGIPSNVILYDICCGTGTIALTLASKVKHVVGIELLEQAVEDAKKNAELNDIKNVEFHCGRAEDLLPSLVKKQSFKNDVEIVAIVDPPRPGLHNKVIQCLRKCPLLRKIIYVSCNPNSVANNFIDLCKPASKRMSGLPFLPYCAQPIDLFPQTPHCELVVYFKRISDKKDQVENKEITVTPIEKDGVP